MIDLVQDFRFYGKISEIKFPTPGTVGIDDNGDLFVYIDDTDKWCSIGDTTSNYNEPDIKSITVCQHCGAPINTKISYGLTKCEYCGGYN